MKRYGIMQQLIEELYLKVLYHYLGKVIIVIVIMIHLVNKRIIVKQKNSLMYKINKIQIIISL